MTLSGTLKAVGLATCILAAFLIGRRCGRSSPSCEDNPRVVETIIRDTIVREKPVSVTRTKTVTQYVAVHDTIRLHDTLYVPLPREQVVWRDSLAEVYASGIYPSVDSVRHFVSTRVVTVTQTQKAGRWSFGIGAGPSVGYFITPAGWQPGAGVAVMVGVNYRF